MAKKTDKKKDQAGELNGIITEVWLREQLPLTYAKLILLIKSLDECEKENHFNNVTFGSSFMSDVMEKGKLLDYVTNNINIEKVNYDHIAFGYLLERSFNTKTREEIILRYLAVTCLLIPEWFKKLDLNNEDRFPIEVILMQKSYEAIGYWTAKLEENMRNLGNLEKRIKEKAERKNELREWIKTTMKPAERHLKAMEKWKVSERTILKDEQEIREESKAQDTTDILKLVTPEMEQEIKQAVQAIKIGRKKKLEEIKRNPKIIEIMDEKWETEKSAFLRKYNDMT